MVTTCIWHNFYIQLQKILQLMCRLMHQFLYSTHCRKESSGDQRRSTLLKNPGCAIFFNLVPAKYLAIHRYIHARWQELCCGTGKAEIE
jgi:hypothetical protein